MCCERPGPSEALDTVDNAFSISFCVIRRTSWGNSSKEEYLLKINEAVALVFFFALQQAMIGKASMY